MSSSVVQMIAWKGLVLQQGRQCSTALFQYRNPCAAALLRAPVPFRQVSSSSLPERYVPKKSGKGVAGREGGKEFGETRISQPYDSESEQLRADRRYRDSGKTNVEIGSHIRSNYGSEFGAGGEKVLVEGFESTKERESKLQGMPGDVESHYEGLFAPHVGPDASDLTQTKHKGKGVENHDRELAAKDYCITLLALAPQPEAKLRMKMSKKNFSSEIIDAVIADLQQGGLQSDQDYAEVFARSRWKGNAWGPNRIKFELQRRGISKENIEAGLRHVFHNNEKDEENEEEDEAGKWGMSQEAAEQLLSQARQRWTQGSKLDINTRKRRMAGWLQRRGFSWDITSDLLRILERE